MNWKREIIKMTQFEGARKWGIDATFFPALNESQISEWEGENDVRLPERWRGFYLQSNGLEAQKGELLPILPLEECVVLPKSCSLENPWIEMGRSLSHRYFLNLGLSTTVFRVEALGSESEFFAASLPLYLKAVFQGKS